MTSSMKHILPLTRRVENTDGNSLTIIPKDKQVIVELGSEWAVIQLPFDNPNDLRAIAGHLMAEADELQRNQAGG